MRGFVMSADPTNWRKRQALQIAAQLPEEPDDARAVLLLVEELMGLFIDPKPPTPSDGADDQAVVRFPGGSSTPSRRANSSGNPSVLPK